MTDVWTMQSREDELEYIKQHGIDLPFDAKHSYSRDRNLWHISHEGLELEDPPTNQTTKICWFSVFLRKMLRISRNM